MTQAIHERIKIIDVDTHIAEPYDLWTSRVSVTKWGDRVPHVVRDEETANDVWVLGGKTLASTGRRPTVGIVAAAGWPKPPPEHPATLAEADPACYDAHARLRKMDEYGIHAHLIYPNVGGFGAGGFLQLKDADLMLECVRAYNDFLTDWCSADPNRLIPLTAVPFWDVEAAVKEIERCAKRGHRGILFTNGPHTFGQPFLADPHWNPIWEIASELQSPVNFHIGNGNFTADMRSQAYEGNGKQANYVRFTTNLFLDNALGIEDVILGGICHRYPKVNFVSVESGVGYLPFLLETLDWQWLNSGCAQEHPEWGGMLPSDFFRRQIYGCFWFERGSARAAIDLLGADNLMFETDFPHPTSLSPGPASTAENPKEHVAHALGNLPEETLRKVLHDNAARIYHLG